MKRQRMDCEKIFANNATDKGLNFQNIPTDHTITKNKQPNQKLGRTPK